MPNLHDAEKREEWRSRLDRFDAGDLSIAQFCRDEGVGTHTFYYWRKRLGRKPDRNRQSRLSANKRPKQPKQSVAVAPTANQARTTKSEAHSNSEPVIHFTWDSGLSFSIPTDCLDAFRFVLEYASSKRTESRDSGTVVNAFRQVIVD